MARSRNHSLLDAFSSATPGIGKHMDHPGTKLYYQLSRHETETELDLFHLTESSYEGAQPTVDIVVGSSRCSFKTSECGCSSVSF